MVLQGGEPFFLQGGKHGVILTHGFTGTPAEGVCIITEATNSKGISMLRAIQCWEYAWLDMVRHRRLWHEQAGRNGMILSVMAIPCWQAVVTKYPW